MGRASRVPPPKDSGHPSRSDVKCLKPLIRSPASGRGIVLWPPEPQVRRLVSRGKWFTSHGQGASQSREIAGLSFAHSRASVTTASRALSPLLEVYTEVVPLGAVAGVY